MKEISFKNNRSIRTPWLRIDEAAAYCSLSRSAFLAHAHDLPHGGNNRTRIYHVDVLDDWLANRFDADTPRTGDDTRSRAMTSDREGAQALINPHDGTVHPVMKTQ